MRIILVDATSTNHKRQQAVNTISTMAFSSPVDFVFDYINNRLALALDFEGHPELVAYLKTLPSQQELRVVGGRFGRAASGALATSEWSGHYGEDWNCSTRDSFIKFMENCGIQIVHREWHANQTANQVG